MRVLGLSAISPFLIIAAVTVLLMAEATRSTQQASLGDELTMGLKGLDLPISFAANHGQADDSVAFVSQNGGFDVFAAERGPVLALPSADGVAAVEVRLIGGNEAPPITGRERLPGTVNYFIGADSSKWLTNIPTYRGVTYEGVYPGIDLAIYGNQSGQMEYDFIVAPGANPSVIGVAFDGVSVPSLEPDGSLILKLANGEVKQLPPVVYQNVGRERVPVDGSYVVDGGIVRFAIGSYDQSLPLVIDPVIAWASFLGGANADTAWAVATDVDGNVYVAGETNSTDFPVTSGAFSETFTGQPNQPDAFVTKVNPQGTAILYSTYIGGDSSDRALDIEVDGDGQAFVGGISGGNFPGGGTGAAGFIAKLSSDGSTLIYSKTLGTNTQVFGIEVDGQGQAYFAGHSLQAFFEATAGSFQVAPGGNGDGIVGVLNADGTDLIWGSHIGGSQREFAHDVALDSDGYVYVTGVTPSDDYPTVNPFQAAKGAQPDAFVARIMPDGSSLMYSTYLGGDGGGLSDSGLGIDADENGNAYVTGYTNSADFPTTAGAFQQSLGGGQDAFITKFNPNGGVVYSTYLGGNNTDRGAGIEVDGDNNAHIAGSTASVNFPTANPFQGANAGAFDAFVASVNANGSALIFSTYLGGADNDRAGDSGGNADGGAISVDEDGFVYVVGTTESPNFPTTNGAFQASDSDIGVQGGLGGGFDGFVTKIGDVSLSGDIDCSDVVDPIDALKILRADAGLSNPAVANCPDIGDLALINGVQRIWGDLNCSGGVDPVDSLILLRYDAGLSINVPAGCPQLGDIITVEQI